MAMIAAASMTQDSGFHMKPRNLRNLLSCGHQNPSYKQLLYIYTRSTQQVGGKKETNLLLLELVWAKDFEALLRLLGGETLAAASQILEHFLEGDVLLQRRERRKATQLLMMPRTLLREFCLLLLLLRGTSMAQMLTL
jgi:hypothetical protein